MKVKQYYGKGDKMEKTEPINWYEVCESIPIDVKKHHWCQNCSENIAIGNLNMCIHNKDL